MRIIKYALLLISLALAVPSHAANRKPLVLGATGTTQQLQTSDNILLNPSTTTLASVNIPHGTAPTSPVNGDLWTTTSGSYIRINGVTVGPLIAQTNPASNVAIGSYSPSYDSCCQLQVFQTQSSFLTNGTLGAVFGQRIVSYTGGAADWAHATVNASVRGYSNIGANVGIVNESAGLFVTDNFSNVAGGLGAACTTFNWNGGPSWGCVNEVKEKPRTFTATASQTVFPIGGGFTSIALVTKNGTALTTPGQYTLATPNVTLVSGATVGDIIRVYPANPAQGNVGTEIDITAGLGTDTANTHAGNRQGLTIIGRRDDQTYNILSHAGSLLNLYASPNDATYFIADRGLNFQGRFGIGIDFTSTDAVFSTWKMKISNDAGGSGISALGSLSIGNLGALDISGYGVGIFGNSTNGGIIRVGDGTHMARISGTSGSGVQFGSDTNDDTILTRNSAEQARFAAAGFTLTVPAILKSYTVGTLPTCNSGETGAMAYVTDATTPTYNAALTGSGAVKVPVFCNGSAWTSH